ncbi:MAG: GNAT family N-acetyltransferase [Planctomycetes bacterium]|nr:GNAT family N-acetyltransferase [Planctomycetota bacterium]
MSSSSFDLAPVEGPLSLERVDESFVLGVAERRELAALFAACFSCCRTDEEPAAADWRWLLRVDGRIACHVAVRRQGRTGRFRRLGHLAYCATLPAWRCRGLGARLLRQVQADAPSLALDGVVLHAERDAVRLYQRAGWREIAPCAYYRAERRRSEDPVLAWSPKPACVERLRCECYRFQRDW